MAFTIVLALLLSFGLRYWGSYHLEPLVASGLSISLLLCAPVLGIGLFALLLGFKQI